MKFRNLGRGLIALAALVVLGIGIVSCGNSYPVAYIYTTGVQYNQIEGFSVTNNTGALTKLPGTPLGSAGSVPRRALISPNGIYLYIVNSGCAPAQLLAPSGVPACSGTAAPTGTNITVFSLNGNGTPRFLASYNSAGYVPLDAAIDANGTFLYVLDAYAPTAASSAPLGASTPSTGAPCADTAETALYHPAGDITVFSIDSTSGRLTPASGAAYFPVGCNPVGMKLSANALFVAQAGSATNAAHSASDKSSVYVYGIGNGGQLTTVGRVATGGSNLTGIGGDRSGRYIYVLDSGADPNNPADTTNLSYVIPYSIGSGGTLTELSQGRVANTSTAGIPAQGPTSLVVDSEGKFLYVGNQGTNYTTTNPNSEITAYLINQSTGSLSYLTGEPFGAGSGSQCLLEDPSNQYLYSANFNDSTVTGRLMDHNAGVLNVLTHGMTFGTVGETTGCAASGHTQ